MLERLRESFEDARLRRIRYAFADTDEAETPAGEAETPSGDAAVIEPPPTLEFVGTSLARKASKYLIRAEGGELYVRPRKLEGAIDPRAGRIGAASMITFGRERIGMLRALVLDLDGDGIELTSRKKAKATFDMDGDGIRDDTGWMNKREGILVVDRNGDGQITTGSEISLLDLQSATSAFAAFATYDTNRDGLLDAADARFSEIKIWADRNGNGRSDTGELRSLAEHGIASLGLDVAAFSMTAKPGSNMVLATAVFTRSDGRTGTLAEAAFAFRPSAAPASEAIEPGDEVPEVPSLPEAGFEASVDGTLLRDRGVPFPELRPLVAERALDFEIAAASALPEASQSSAAVPVAAGREAEADYAARIETAQIRLVQALSAFRPDVGMASFSSTASQAALGQSPWLAIGQLPSVREMPSI